MPTYEYECADCAETYDVVQRMIDPPLKSCLKCGGTRVRKRLSIPTILVRRSQPSAFERETQGSGPFTIDATVPCDFRHPRMGFRLTKRQP